MFVPQVVGEIATLLWMITDFSIYYTPASKKADTTQQVERRTREHNVLGHYRL